MRLAGSISYPTTEKQLNRREGDLCDVQTRHAAENHPCTDGKGHVESRKRQQQIGNTPAIARGTSTGMSPFGTKRTPKCYRRCPLWG